MEENQFAAVVSPDGLNHTTEWDYDGHCEEIHNNMQVRGLSLPKFQ